MRAIQEKIMSHIMERRKLPEGSWYREGFVPPKDEESYGYAPNFQKTSVAKIRQNPGYSVKTYRELVSFVAQLGHDNHRYNLMFRGQTEDFHDSKGKSVAYPTIFRPKNGQRSIRKTTIESRFKHLRKAIEKLRKHFRPSGSPDPLFRYREYQMALIQHYGICPTPLLDVTQSLRVAATFALQNNVTTGYVFLFGMPYPNGSISHYVDENMVMVKLQSVCPRDALRPHYQEGWLVGRLALTPTKEAGDNAARRLIGKYKLDNKDAKFWDENFQPIPMDTLMPEKDSFRDIYYGRL